MLSKRSALPSMLVLGVFTFALLPQVSQAYFVINQYGQIVSTSTAGQVLGDRSDGESSDVPEWEQEREREQEQNADNDATSAQERAREQAQELLKKQTEAKLAAQEKSREQTQKEQQLRLETEKESREQAREELKSSRSVKLIPNGDRFLLQVEDENGETVDASASGQDSDRVEIEDHITKNTITLRTQDNAAYVIRNKIGAESKFPLQVNLDTNELIVTTPNGAKVVTVLPDKAVENMLAANVLDQLGGKGGMIWLNNQITPTPLAADSADLLSSESGELATESALVAQAPATTSFPDEAETVVSLVEDDNGVLSYKLTGTKFKKLFGIKEIELNREVYVSAETGELLSIQQSLMDRLLSLLSTN